MKTLSQRTEEMIDKAYPTATQEEKEKIKTVVIVLSQNALEQVKKELLSIKKIGGKESSI